MGVCLGKLHPGRAINVQDGGTAAAHHPLSSAITTATAHESSSTTKGKANHVAPQPPTANSLSTAMAEGASPHLAEIPPRQTPAPLSNLSSSKSVGGGGAIGSGSGGSPPKLHRSMTMTGSSMTGKRATFTSNSMSPAAAAAVSIATAASSSTPKSALAKTSSLSSPTATTSTPPTASATTTPTIRPRHMSVRPELTRVGSTRRVDEGRRRGGKKKPVNVTLDVLLKDERARVGFFHYLEATSLEDALSKQDAQGSEISVELQPSSTSTPLDSPARLKRRASKLTQSRMTVDYREDCVLFWLEISDLLKVPTGGSFHLGLMQDLFDVYVSKHAPRLLPMVSSAEREPLAQFLQDRNVDRALLALKMLLLDVLEIVTAAFDEYVRCDTKLGYAQATRNESMRNVLARLAKGNVVTTNNDRRAQLNDVLNTPSVCRMFREFLQERSSVENLLFIIDALAFEDLVNSFETEAHDDGGQRLTESDQQSRNDYCLRQAQKIFNKYIRYGSKAEICLGGVVKGKLLKDIVEYPLSAQVFNDAVLLCSAELVQSHLDMFYRSHAYAQYQLTKKQLHKKAVQERRRSANSQSNAAPSSTQPTHGDAGGHGAYDDRKVYTLGEILNSIGVNFFRDFLKQESAENTLLFYKEVEQFQLLPHGQKHYIQIKARKIFDRFVRRGGKLEIELPMDVRRDILFKLSSPSEFTFVDALKYVVGLWEARYMEKFKAHRLYSEMLTALENAPPPSAIALSAAGMVTRRESGISSAVAAAAVAGGVGGGAGGGGSSGGGGGGGAMGNSADWVDVTKITLREFLDLEFLRKYFRHFLEKEQCVNELHFYFEIANFQQFPTSDYLTRQAKKLYSRFCDPQSREYVLLREDMQAELLQSLPRPSPAMFNKTQDEIFSFFQSTLFPKFQQSEIYRTIQLTHNQLRGARQAAMSNPDDETTNDRRGSTRADAANGANGGGGGGGNRRTSEAGGGQQGRGYRRSSGASAALPELPEESVSVTMILENQETRSLFLSFAEEIFCTESIYFWLDCNEYKDIPHRNYLKLRAQKIYRKYISGRAKLQVNLESTIIKEIVKSLDDPSRTLFIVAQKSITKMLERDTLPKFRKSKHFQPCHLILRAAMINTGSTKS